MKHLKVGDQAPDFSVKDQSGNEIKLSDYEGKRVVIYFYPKDNTPGCTLEGQQFRDNIAEFDAKNTLIIGVSRDSVRVHEGFKEKHAFPFDLLSDKDETVCQLFGVIQLKKNYGREYMGIVRSTFLIDENGILRQEWRNVKVKTHLEEVLEGIHAL